MEPENPLLDLYILNQSGKKNPKICYVPIASGDSDICISWFYSFFEKQECQPSHLSLFSRRKFKAPRQGIQGLLRQWNQRNRTQNRIFGLLISID